MASNDSTLSDDFNKDPKPFHIGAFIALATDTYINDDIHQEMTELMSHMTGFHDKDFGDLCRYQKECRIFILAAYPELEAMDDDFREFIAQHRTSRNTDFDNSAANDNTGRKDLTTLSELWLEKIEDKWGRAYLDIAPLPSGVIDSSKPLNVSHPDKNECALVYRRIPGLIHQN